MRKAVEMFAIGMASFRCTAEFGRSRIMTDMGGLP
jgi:hypothetical protein